MDVPNGAARPNLTSADGRPISLEMSTAQLRALSEVLKPGEVVTGRVLERFAGGTYLFALRGRNLIAESNVELARDSAVRFQVLGGADGRVSLRMLEAVPRDRFDHAGPQLARLGLADTPPRPRRRRHVPSGRSAVDRGTSGAGGRRHRQR